MIDDFELRLREIWPNLRQEEIDAAVCAHERLSPAEVAGLQRSLEPPEVALEQRLRETWPELSDTEVAHVTRFGQLDISTLMHIVVGRHDEIANGVTSVIYFMQSGRGGPIKIGFTECTAERRLAELQTGNPSELIVLTVLSGTQAQEKELHRLLAAHRIQGEWFEPALIVLEVALRSKTIGEAIERARSSQASLP
jgi:hypothetical protein